jgi:hypothetical protein
MLALLLHHTLRSTDVCPCGAIVTPEHPLTCPKVRKSGGLVRHNNVLNVLTSCLSSLGLHYQVEPSLFHAPPGSADLIRSQPDLEVHDAQEKRRAVDVGVCHFGSSMPDTVQRRRKDLSLHLQTYADAKRAKAKKKFAHLPELPFDPFIVCSSGRLPPESQEFISWCFEQASLRHGVDVVSASGASEVTVRREVAIQVARGNATMMLRWFRHLQSGRDSLRQLRVEDLPAQAAEPLRLLAQSSVPHLSSSSALDNNAASLSSSPLSQAGSMSGEPSNADGVRRESDDTWCLDSVESVSEPASPQHDSLLLTQSFREHGDRRGPRPSPEDHTLTLSRPELVTLSPDPTAAEDSSDLLLVLSRDGQQGLSQEPPSQDASTTSPIETSVTSPIEI